MRLLHTADWHLGQRFHDQRRADDERHALEQILALARERQVDSILVAGDVFDTANPGAEEQERYYDFLSRARSEAGVASVVVIGGNHDSALRLDGPRQLLSSLGIHVVGRWPRDAAPDRCLIRLADRSGRERALCVAVPFLRDADLRLAEAGESAAEIHDRYRQALEGRYGEALEAASRAAGSAGEGRASPSPTLPLVVMGHCFAAGGELGGGERRVQVGNLARAHAAALAGGAAYLALGHLHRPQQLAGNPAWRYSGSLLPTGFDEVGRRREVVLVELDGSGTAAVETAELEPFRDYHRLAGTVAEVEAAIDALPRPGEGKAVPWCEASVRLDGPRPGLARELVERARERGWSLISIRREQPGGREPGAAAEAAPELHELDPLDVFTELHRRRFDAEPEEDLRLEFLRLLESVRHADQDPTAGVGDGPTAASRATDGRGDGA
ncbi:MAG: exonuclease SbcCD subunit D C-terminal domain-containing protein [Holophagales bacterium]|nr:exonuclease SbcCD subunit D C-terminal domain-containing protein [Holophagales bacterium]